jgi:uncharacterized protein YbbK (DUF523 family)
MTAGPKPVVIVSKCLLGERCRYDGEPVSAPAVLNLSKLVKLVPVCPETGIGLPVPRDPIRLVRTGDRIRLVQTRTGIDLTGKMRTFCRQFLAGLTADGFILKARSPSCAVRDARVHDATGKVLRGMRRPGFFAAAVLDSLPDVPVADETALSHRRAREHFLARVLAATACTGKMDANPCPAAQKKQQARDG